MGFCLITIGTPSPIYAEGSQTTDYIVVDYSGSSVAQKAYVYNKGRLETEIWPDHSLVQYTYDNNGNLLKKNKSASIEPYLISSTAVSYDLYVLGVPTNVQKVEFNTWTETNGQDDLEWIIGEKLASGIWKGNVSIPKHGGSIDTYNTHIYIDGRMIRGLTAKIVDTAQFIVPSQVSLADGFYEIYVKNVANTVSEIRFPTWTDYNSQDDLVNPWITGERMTDGAWRIRIPFSEHNFETGNYITHFYAYDKYGASRMFGEKIVSVQGGPGGSKETDLAGVSYDVFMYGVDSKVNKVEFPTWTETNGQDDLEWIQGQKIAPGVWRATIVYDQHNAEQGRYFTHIYADGKMIGYWEFNVVQAVKFKSPSVAYLSSGYYDITIEGIPSNVTTVRFPTWTEKNGQDDLEDPWIEGERLTSTNWRIRIPYYKHNNETGAYNTHIYTYDAYGNSRIIRMFTVDVRN
ncbi:GBS Bsp-like repeat-containing protein [Paenibacillus sp. S150]|uniref:GBS Bsp-like repeat-containing protein n=1 Tax=Paenibacillus sp. S150 TaxID=2749826 RepID=UPI001C58E305|nr:GBS Bsp-like repeat-containing protein [Paenibacillus sp. S150]MBW4084560.1 GBS Bsp-like repeat-containing protein [Paenibacillus sp. S150]